ncbi:MAG: ATP-binding protein [Planctomycetota bacterium]|jgi:ferredoxin
MTKRKIISIDEEKCTGCAECIPNCPEGALQVIDGKARLVSHLFCDGLGACVGHCPTGAMTVEEREAEPYDERRVMENIVKQGPNTIAAHLSHLRGHGADDYLREAVGYLKERGIAVPGNTPRAPFLGGCPGTRVGELAAVKAKLATAGDAPAAGPGLKAERPSRLRNWPVQLKLVPPIAPWLKGAELLIAADCVPFALPDFHEELLKGRVLLVGCPKLDDAEAYVAKLAAVFEANDVRSVTVAHMEVPCCFGLVEIVKQAIARSGKAVPFEEVTVGVEGGVLARA